MLSDEQIDEFRSQVVSPIGQNGIDLICEQAKLANSLIKDWGSEKKYADRWRQLRTMFYHEQMFENTKVMQAEKEKA